MRRIHVAETMDECSTRLTQGTRGHGCRRRGCATELFQVVPPLIFSENVVDSAIDILLTVDNAFVGRS